MAIARYKATRNVYVKFNLVIKEIKRKNFRLRLVQRPMTNLPLWVYYQYTGKPCRPQRIIDNCVYCNRRRIMTKEHIVPRCYGGIMTMLACRECNGKRGCSMTWKPFLRWKIDNPSLYKKALISAINNNKKIYGI